MKRMFLLFICFSAVFGFVLPVSAFEQGIRGYYWFPELSGVIRVDGAGIVGAELDLEDDLGLDNESYPVVEVFARIGKHHLSLAFYNLDYDGDSVLSKDILEARVLVTGIGYSDNTAFDGEAEISLTPFPFLDIHGGYRLLKIDVEEDDVKFDFDNSGLYVALTVSF